MCDIYGLNVVMRFSLIFIKQ